MPLTPPPPTDVTRLIRRVDSGDATARADLWDLVYDELRQVAAHHMVRERAEHTLQPTALVHEAWLRLAGGPAAPFEGRAHFFGVAAEAMRRILIEHARRRNALRRGGGRTRAGGTVLEALAREDGMSVGELADDIEALDLALSRFEEDPRHRRKAEVVKLRFFVGLTVDQAADILEMSTASVKRDWDFAKAWLSREIRRAGKDDA